MVVVEDRVRPLAGRRDQQKEKAEEHGEQTLAGSGSDTRWGLCHRFPVLGGGPGPCTC